MEPEENIEQSTEKGTEEIVPEDGEGAVETAEAKLKKLRDELKQCQSEKQDYLAMSQRLKADYLNLRREVEANRSEIVKFANEGVLRELIDLADSFELAFANREQWEVVDENWRRGVEYIYTKLLNILTQHGLREILALHENFDPLRHHALELVATDKPEELNRVVKVVQKGYSLHNKIIRPAQVRVGSATNQ
ncbi:MAG: nucleotide exchange factor GrpE [Candidatus Vogelbacteria bacterium]|nr:nucleotide exchange factor GrpE [Candidatus Vogelbacteria bacterium]